MPSISELNVRLGLIYKDLDKGLEQVEKRMRASGRRLSDLGDQMTVAISLPLAAAGAAAIKSAGDIESLQFALESQVGSAAAARKELELLRQEALKPGLGFEQAVRGSVSLQAVGFSAEKARKIISEFGNGLAIAGKGAAELDGVITALTQIQSKGVVSAEEINQIAERLPQIRTLMQQAFGTASSEAIQKLGISSQQFIEGITAQLEKLPRATGGIKNSLENFFDAIKLGAAKFGETISKAFDVPAKLETFAAGLTSVADGFAALNPETQKFIIGMAATAVAAGPVLKIFGALSSAGAQFIGVMQGSLGVLKGVTGTVLGLTDAVNRLKLAFGIIGIVAAVGTAVYLLSQRFDAATYAQEQYAEATRAVATESAKELGALDKNFAVLKNVTSTNGERKAAIDALLAQYPSYFKGMNLEIQSVDQLTKLQKGLVEQIQRGVAERKKAEAINSIYEKRAEILLRVQQLRDGADATAGEATLIDTGDMIKAGGIAEAVILKLQKQSDDLALSADKTGKQFDQAFGLMGAAARRASPASQVLGEIKPVTDAAAASAVVLSKAQKDQASAAKKLGDTYKEVLSDIANVSAQQDLLGSEKIIEQAKAIEGGIKKLLDAGFKPASVQVQQLKKDLDGLFAGAKLPNSPNTNSPVSPTIETLPTSEQVNPLGPQFGGEDKFKALAASIAIATEKLTAFKSVSQQLGEVNLNFQGGLIGFNEAFKQTAEIVAANGTLMQQAILGAASAMSEAASSGASSLGTLASAAVGAAAKIVRAWIQQGVAAAVAKALSGLPFPFNIAAGAAAGALAAGAFNKVLNAIKVPGFAAGTNFAPGGAAIVGERGPELVNLPRGSQVVPNHRLGGFAGGNNVNVNGTFLIKGPDLVVVLEKAQQQMRRRR